jgi:integrase
MNTVRGLFTWAVDAGLVKVDPTAGVAYPKLPDSDGFPPWQEEDVSLYEKHWPIGTRERVWLDVLLYTGLRRGDAVRLGKQHVRNGIATIKTEKTGTEVTLPILPVLAETLAAGNPAAISHSSPVRSASRLRSIPSAMPLLRRLARLASRVSRRMVCASLERRGRRMLARRDRNSRRSSDGPATAWRRCIRAVPIDVGLRSKACTS